jgi:HEAT repeat protein
VARVRENRDSPGVVAATLPGGVKLTASSLDAWSRLTAGLRLETGPRLLFVIVESPVLRERLALYLAASLTESGFRVHSISLDRICDNPVTQLFEAVAREPETRAHFITGLEQCLSASEQSEAALAGLSLWRERIPEFARAPLVFWLDSEGFRTLAAGAPAFMQWRAGEFRIDEDEGPMAEARARYRRHVIDRFSKLTLYSVTSDKPLAVDLERVFVKLTATERQPLQGIDLPASLIYQSSLLKRLLEAATSEARRAVLIDWRERPAERQITLNEALAAHSELAVIGAPGSGKTTLLRYIALSFARRQAKARLGLDEDRLPVFVTLRDFNKYVEHLDRSVPGAAGLLSEMLEPYLAWFHSEYFPSLGLPDGFFAALLAENRCIILADGLDEVADSLKREQTARFVGACAARYGGNRFVVTSRPRGYEAGRQHLAGEFAECTIQDFDEEQISGFVKSWYLAVTVDREGDTLTARDLAAKSAEDLLAALKSDRVRALATNPLLLSILALIHQRGNRLPQRRVALYEECIEFLLGFWRQVQGGEAARELARIGGLTSSEKRVVIEPVALWLHERGESGAEVSRAELEQQLALQFQDLYGQDRPAALARAASFVDIIVEHAGLLVERETGVFAFAHLTFQEFLAARALADRGDYIEFILPRLHDPWWREVILLLAGHLSTPCTRRSRAETAGLLKAIREAASPLEEVLHRDLLLAFRCLCDAEHLGVDQSLRAEVTGQVIELWRKTASSDLRGEVVALFAYAAPTPVGELLVRRLLELSQDASHDARSRAAFAIASLGAAAATSAALERLLELSQDANDDVRRDAADAIGRLGAPAATPAVLDRLLELSQDPNNDMRRRAAFAIGSLGASAATPVVLDRLLQLIQDASDDERSIAADAIGRLGAPAATSSMLDRLLELSQDANDDVRSRAANAIGSLGALAATPAVLGRLLELIQDANDDVRSRAADAIGSLGAPAATPAVLDRLLELSRDPNNDMRSRAAYAIGSLGAQAATPAVLDRLLKLIQDANEGVWSVAAYAIGSLGAAAVTPAVLDRLLELSHDASDDVRSIAAYAIDGLGASAATPAMVDRLLELSQDANDDVRRRAAYAIGSLGAAAPTPAVVGRLLQLSQDPNDNVRSSAAHAIAMLGASAATPAALDRLLELIQDANDDVRRSAANVIGMLGAAAATPAVLGRLLELSQDPNNDVRSIAAYAIARLGAAAATPAVVDRLLKLIQDANDDVRSRAAYAIGSLGATVATPAAVDRLLKLIQDANDYVPSPAAANIAWALGGSREKLSPYEVDKLIRFWTGLLGSTERSFVGGEYRSLDSAAYGQLHELAALIPRGNAPHSRTSIYSGNKRETESVIRS